MEWMLMPYRKLYALIAGRSSRREFWMFVLFNVIIFAVIISLVLLLVGGASLTDDVSQMGPAIIGAGIAFMLLFIPIYIWVFLTGVASIAVTIRRFHDMDLTGWAYLPFLILGMVPFVNLLVWIVLIVVMCQKGTDGPNRYGADPLAPVDDTIFS